MFKFLKNRFTMNKKEELETVLKNNAFLVDVRSAAEFAEGNVPGSVNIPLDQIEKQLSKLKQHKNIIVFCRSGNRSGQAKTILEQNGFTDVINGGTWQQIKEAINETRR
ncbi:rhodanese-like domain-containing protein [Flavobacterium agricola]|uniref:Rhodanese-like domain-containing protein n=2 Tax=Flavobacterium agricola TaxID=2870839 RepID=A0ABY6M201_9FLAO|nr:rhodanese-like domain-containing protein [Flavobacterium agricola]